MAGSDNHICTNNIYWLYGTHFQIFPLCLAHEALPTWDFETLLRVFPCRLVSVQLISILRLAAGFIIGTRDLPLPTEGPHTPVST